MNPLGNGKIYLSREGKISGPFTPGQLEEFRTSGELFQYAWLWDGISSKWTTIHAEPPPPAVEQIDLTKGRTIGAVCYDHGSLIGGVVESITQDEGSVYCDSDIQSLSVFKAGQMVIVNLVEEATGRSENISAVVTQVTRESEGFRYRFRWQNPPLMLQPA